MTSYDRLHRVSIKYSAHAVQRMVERKITPDEVESIITTPDGSIRQTKEKYIHYKKLTGRKDNLVAAVTVERTNTYIEVVTVMVNFEVKK